MAKKFHKCPQCGAQVDDADGMLCYECAQKLDDALNNYPDYDDEPDENDDPEEDE